MKASSTEYQGMQQNSYTSVQEQEDEKILLASPLCTTRITACVFGSSSNKTPKTLLNEAYHLGTLLAKRGHGIVTGGGAFGCMHAVQSGCRQHGGSVRGVVHQLFVDGGSADTENITTMTIVTGDDLGKCVRNFCRTTPFDILLRNPSMTTLTNHRLILNDTLQKSASVC